MKRQNQYDITIKFQTSEKDTELFSGTIPYLGSASYHDQIKISQKQIVLNCKRTSVIKLDEIFNNHNSSLYNQIIKVLVYYYSMNFNCPAIKEIHVTRKATLEILEEKTLDVNDIMQPVANKIKSSIVFNPEKIKIIFEETDKGKTLLIALSYWLKAMSTKDYVFTFERLWRGLNSIYSFVGNRANETNCHIALRTLTINHPEILSASLEELEKLNSENLRISFRWRALILNDYPLIGKTIAYKDFILRYTDKRIMHVINETLTYRQDFLTRQGLLAEVNNHINANLATATKSNSELISLLCIKYSYFVRNKSFHGEKIDGTFRLVDNKETKELEKLNILLSLYIADLINSNELY